MDLTKEDIDNYIASQHFQDWLVSRDCHGTRMVKDLEKSDIEKQLKKLKKLEVVSGDLLIDQPNTFFIDITEILPGSKLNQTKEGKQIHTTLAHYIRPCLCEDDKCKQHGYQYECYLENCKCCTDECT